MSVLIKLIEAEHSKKQTNKIVKHIGKDQRRFVELLKIALGKDPILSQRASWPLGYCVKDHPEFAKKHLDKIIKHLAVHSHPAINRNLTKLLIYSEIPEKLEPQLLENCFAILNSTGEPIANRAYSAYVIEKLCRKYPDLYPELISCLQNHSDITSPGMKAVTRNILKSRNKILKSL